MLSISSSVLGYPVVVVPGPGYYIKLRQHHKPLE